MVPLSQGMWHSSTTGYLSAFKSTFFVHLPLWVVGRLQLGVVSSGTRGTSGDCHPVSRWNSLLKALRSRRASSQNSTNLRGTEHNCLRKNDVKFCDLFFRYFEIQSTKPNVQSRCKVPMYQCALPLLWMVVNVPCFHGFFKYVVRRENKKSTEKNATKTPKATQRKPKFEICSQMLRPLCLGDCRRCLTSKVFVTKLSTRNHERNQKKCSNEN